MYRLRRFRAVEWLLPEVAGSFSGGLLLAESGAQAEMADSDMIAASARRDIPQAAEQPSAAKKFTKAEIEAMLSGESYKKVFCKQSCGECGAVRAHARAHVCTYCMDQ